MVNQDCHLVGGTLTASTNEVLRIIFETKAKTATRRGKKIISSYNLNFSPNTCSSIRNFCLILLGWRRQRRWDGRCMNHWWERCIQSDGRDAHKVMEEMHTKWWGKCIRSDGRDAYKVMGEMHTKWWERYTQRDGGDAYEVMEEMHTKSWKRCIQSHGRDAYNVMGEMHTKLQPGNPQDREHLNGLGKTKLKWLFFGKYIVRVRDKGH